MLQCFSCSSSLVTVKDKGQSEALGGDGQVAALTGLHSSDYIAASLQIVSEKAWKAVSQVAQSKKLLLDYLGDIAMLLERKCLATIDEYPHPREQVGARLQHNVLCHKVLLFSPT